MESIQVKVAEAEVYRQGCTVILQGSADVREGANHLVVTGLPSGLDEGSVSLRMPRVVSQGQVSVRYADLGVEGQSDELTELDQRIDELDRKIENKETELASWKGLSSKMDGSAALDYLERLPPKLDELTAGLVDLKNERRTLSVQRDQLREAELRPRLEVDVTSTQAGSLPVELSVRSSNAGWDPEYDVLVEQIGEPLRLRMKGSVWQATGLPWDDVTLRLSTGTAAVMGDLPRFVPCYLSKAQPHVQVAPPRAAMKARGLPLAAPLMASSSADDTMAGMLDFSDVQEMSAPEAVVERQATATTYELPGTQSLESAHKAQTFVVSTSELEATYRLYAYPRRDEAAYLVAHLDEEPLPEVIEQPLSVYLEGSYAGTIRIGAATDEGGYELPLGRDELVRVRRREEVRRSKKLLGGKVVVGHTSTITVESRKDLPVEVVVLELVPISQDKEIEVTLKETSGAAHDTERGELRWERTLEAGGRLSLVASYEVTHPKGVVVSEQVRQVASARGPVRGGYCSTCGSPIEPGQTFCAKCGMRVS